MQPGYYRDDDSWLYLTSTGKLYYVSGNDTPDEPAWKLLDLPLEDAEPATPMAEELESFERVRVAYGIEA
jgi:hypothetical protein